MEILIHIYMYIIITSRAAFVRLSYYVISIKRNAKLISVSYKGPDYDSNKQYYFGWY